MKRKTIIIGVIFAVLLLTVTVTAFAVSGYTMTYLPGTTDTVTNLPAPDAGTGGEAYTVSSQIPQRQGYEFLCWTLDYGVANYKVTYVITPDPTYGTPEGSTVPTDPTQYPPADPVIVKDQLTTTVDYAFNAKGEKISGTWTFEGWDKVDFSISEDTTITGKWVFTPAPASATYTYYVHYVFFDSTKPNFIGKPVTATKPVQIDSLGIDVVEYAKPVHGSNIRILTDSVSATITRDKQDIYIFYFKYAD